LVALSVVTGHAAAVVVRWHQDLTVFSFFGRNLFYSTSVAVALLILGILAWPGLGGGLAPGRAHDRGAGGRGMAGFPGPGSR
jgi:hypothetical protein